jgi:hypothetical protein
MKKLVAFALVVAALAPAVVAQTASFTGKWEGTMVFLRPNGSEGDSDPVVLNLTQKGKVVGSFQKSPIQKPEGA